MLIWTLVKGALYLVFTLVAILFVEGSFAKLPCYYPDSSVRLPLPLTVSCFFCVFSCLSVHCRFGLLLDVFRKRFKTVCTHECTHTHTHARTHTHS